MRFEMALWMERFIPRLVMQRGNHIMRFCELIEQGAVL